MRLQDFFQNIALGELSGSQLVDVGSYEIDKTQLPRVIQALNQGLEYFYSNFLLKQSQVVVEIKEGISRYYLDSDYAYSNQDSNLPKYICDTLDTPYQDDILHILSVHGLNGYEFPLNDPYSVIGITTPEYNCIQVSNPDSHKHLVVTYQANHPRIKLTEPLTSKVQINLPSSYISALQTYVACLVYQNMGGNHLNESNALFAKFKTLTEELKLQGIGVIPHSGNNLKPLIGQWV